MPAKLPPGCAHKVRYYSTEQVELALLRMKSKMKGKRMHYYKCGDHWHVGGLIKK